MDPLAHTLVGATLAETRLRNGTAAMALPAGVLAANAPDVDAITMLVSRDLVLGFRRGSTHGVLAMVVLPLVLTAVLLLIDRMAARRRGREPQARAGPLLRLTAAGVLSHPFLDWLNTYGVRFLMPFDDTWFYGDALFIIDPWVWLLAGLTVVLAHSASWAGIAGWGLLATAATAVTGLIVGFGRFADTPPVAALAWAAALAAVVRARAAGAWRNRLPQVAGACLAGLAIYAGAMVLASRTAERTAAEALAQPGGESPVEVLAIPAPGNPFRRGIVAADREGYRFYELDWLSDPHLRRVAEPLPRGPEGPVTEAALTAPHVRGFSIWKRFPAYAVEETADGWVVSMSDMRYARRVGGGFGAVVHLDRELGVRQGPAPQDGASLGGPDSGRTPGPRPPGRTRRTTAAGGR